MFKIMGAALAASLALATQAIAADAPAEIKIGTLYASSGRFASISMPVHSALKLWVEQKNADGGVYVKAFDKKIPIKLVAYDDQSNTATASTLYNQLITQDKVDLLVADSGSVLTAPAVAIARDHKMFLFDQTGTGASFFSKDNPYIALMADPVSTIWPKPVADFITHDGPGLGIKKIAILYSTNEFTGTQANAFRKFVKEFGAPIEIVYDQGIPTETTNYTVIINNINNTNPDAVIHFGYAPNDIAFLRNVQDVGIKFKMLFSIYAGLETELLEKNVGAKGLEHVFTYVPPSELDYPVNFGMNMKDYKAAWDKKYPDGKIEFGFNAVAGYTTGARDREDAVGCDQPRPDGAAPRGVLAVRPAQDARRHLCARRDGRPDRRIDAARPARARRARPHQVRLDLSARDRHRQAGLSGAHDAVAAGRC